MCYDDAIERHNVHVSMEIFFLAMKNSLIYQFHATFEFPRWFSTKPKQKD